MFSFLFEELRHVGDWDSVLCLRMDTLEVSSGHMWHVMSKQFNLLMGLDEVELIFKAFEKAPQGGEQS